MKKEDIWLLFLLLIFAGSVFLVFYKNFPYKFGLDISGGTTLTYQADLQSVKKGEIKDVLSGVKDLIERRINFLGISEVNINYTNSGKIIAEIPNIKDPEKAKKIIGETPLLEFRIPVQSKDTPKNATPTITFLPTKLTGRFLEQAQVEFDQNTMEP